MKADITILLSVRNEEQYIGKTIESILGQSYKNFIFWVIDDGSTDKTLNVAKSFGDDRLVIHHFPESKGLTERLNWAIPQIKTEFIARMDSHNIADKTRLEKQRDYMLKNPEVMALGSNFTRIDELGKVMLKTSFPLVSLEIKKKLMEKNVFKHASMFFRRVVYEKIGLYDSYFRLAQDYDFILRACSKYPVVNLEESLITEIYRGGNLSQKFRVRSAWEAMICQWNGLIKYSYPCVQTIYLIRGFLFMVKSFIFQIISQTGLNL